MGQETDPMSGDRARRSDWSSSSSGNSETTRNEVDSDMQLTGFTDPTGAPLARGTTGGTDTTTSSITGVDDYNATTETDDTTGDMIDTDMTDITDDTDVSDDIDDSDDAGDTDDPDAIRQRIEETRAQMSDTIDAISARLNPDTVKEQVTEQAKEAVQNVTDHAKEMVYDATIGRAEDMVRDVQHQAKRVRRGIFDTIRENPIPAALAGIGLAWLFMNRSSGEEDYDEYSDRNYSRGRLVNDIPEREYYRARPRSYPQQVDYYTDEYDNRRYAPPRYRGESDSGQGGVKEALSNAGDTVSSAADQAKSKVADAASSAKDTAGQLVDQAQSTASDVVDTAQETASQVVRKAGYRVRRTNYRFQEILDDNPLAVGAAAIAVGAALGLAIPETRQEHQLMGEMRDQLVNKAQEVAQDTMDKVQNVAQEATTTIKQEAKEQGLTQSQSSQGQQGAQGSQSTSTSGTASSMGSSGSSGSQSSQSTSLGSQGSTGTQGMAGTQGSSGTQSTSYRPSSTSGSQGTSGTQSTTYGSQSTSGTQGTAGSQGSSGMSGTQGSSGTQRS